MRLLNWTCFNTLSVVGAIASSAYYTEGFIFFLMGNDIIPVQETVFGGESIQSVEAKILYEFLWLRSDHYARWISQMRKSWENWVDYIPSNAINGVSSFLLSLDFAKSIAMMSKSAKGKEVRQYFLNILMLKINIFLFPKRIWAKSQAFPIFINYYSILIS